MTTRRRLRLLRPVKPCIGCGRRIAWALERCWDCCAKAKAAVA